MLLRLRQACDHPLLVKGFDSNSSQRSSLEMAKKLPREKIIILLSCLEVSLAICTICNVSDLSLSHKDGIFLILLLHTLFLFSSRVDIFRVYANSYCCLLPDGK